MKELTNIENILEEMKSILQTNHSVRESQHSMNYSSTNPFAAVLGADIGSIIRLVQFKNSLTDSLKILQEELGPMFAEIGDSHAILEMLNALGSESDRAYVGRDMILLKGNGANLIKVNISAAVRMYQQGHQLLEEKSRIVEALLSALNVELIEGFATEQLKVVRRIDNIESNPSTYRDYFDACSAPVGSSRSEIIGADVHEYLPSLQNIQFDGIHSVLQNEITSAKSFLATSRKAIEDLLAKMISSLHCLIMSLGGENKMYRYYSVNLTGRILPYESHMYKKDVLQQHVDEIQQNRPSFFKISRRYSST